MSGGTWGTWGALRLGVLTDVPPGLPGSLTTVRGNSVKFSLLMKWKSGTCELPELFTVMRSQSCPQHTDSWSGLMSIRGSSGDYRQQQDLQSDFSLCDGSDGSDLQ